MTIRPASRGPGLTISNPELGVTLIGSYFLNFQKAASLFSMINLNILILPNDIL